MTKATFAQRDGLTAHWIHTEFTERLGRFTLSGATTRLRKNDLRFRHGHGEDLLFVIQRATILSLFDVGTVTTEQRKNLFPIVGIGADQTWQTEQLQRLF